MHTHRLLKQNSTQLEWLWPMPRTGSPSPCSPSSLARSLADRRGLVGAFATQFAIKGENKKVKGNADGERREREGKGGNEGRRIEEENGEGNGRRRWRTTGTRVLALLRQGGWQSGFLGADVTCSTTSVTGPAARGHGGRWHDVAPRRQQRQTATDNWKKYITLRILVWEYYCDNDNKYEVGETVNSPCPPWEIERWR